MGITDIKLYVPVVSLLMKESTKLLQRLSLEFKNVAYWNKYLSDMVVKN